MNRSLWITLGKILLIAFLCWHMFAVAVYTLPRDSKSGLVTVAKEFVIPRLTTYMYATSQWQLWNLFAPEPLRRVTYYRIETLRGGEWIETLTIRPGTYSIWRHATRFKLLSNILNEFDGGRAPVAGRMLHLLCTEHNIPPGTQIRLRYEYYVIPKHKKRKSGAWWNAWTPEPKIKTGFITSCPHLP